MEFTRGTDVKKSLQIGKEWKSKKVQHIFISIKDMKIQDTRTKDFRGMQSERDPRTLDSKKLKEMDTHKIFELLSNGTFPWDYILDNIFPSYSSELKEKDSKYRLMFYIILEKGEKGILNSTALSWHQAKGNVLYYDNKFYTIPE